MNNAEILHQVRELLASWQKKLGSEVKVILGGSLASGLHAEDAEEIDVDVRFLVDNPADPNWVSRIESATGLKYRKTIQVTDYPKADSSSPGIMIEGHLTLPGIKRSLDVEGCLRNKKYVGWGRFYPQVFSERELAEIKRKKIALSANKTAYKAYKSSILQTAIKRCIGRGLVDPDHAPYE